MTDHKIFSELHHHRGKPLVLGNVWDPVSAKTLESVGYKALGTSSAALAGVFGFQDGESLPFTVLKEQVRLIKDSVSIPLSVDIEGGYSRNPEIVADHVEQLVDLGVGINIEDSVVDGNRSLLAKEKFVQIITTVKKRLQDRGKSIFLNARTDAYILGLDSSLEITLDRARAYEKAGADGLFVPCLIDKEEIQSVLENGSLPLNLLTIPGLPDFDALAEMGVRRISTGNFVYEKMITGLRTIVEQLSNDQSAESLFQ